MRECSEDLSEVQTGVVLGVGLAHGLEDQQLWDVDVPIVDPLQDPWADLYTLKSPCNRRSCCSSLWVARARRDGVQLLAFRASSAAKSCAHWIGAPSEPYPR